MSGRSRIEILNDLVERNRPISEIKTELSAFSFDSDPLVTVKSDRIIGILLDYIAGKIDADIVEEWADIIEVRDDLEYEAGYENVAKEIIHDLANPILSGPLTTDGAETMILALRGAS